MKDSLIKGTLILTVAGVVVKVIGSLNWIFVSRILGGEGIGLYQMAFPIYFFALSVSTAGVPVAISIITAEKVALKDILGAKRVFKISMGLMFVTGLIFSLLTYFAASWLIEWNFIRDERAYWSVVALSPAIFFVTLLASSRGYLQGFQQMTPTAVSQIVEQIFRVITMIAFATMLLPYGLDKAAAGASLGAFFGAITGLLVLVYFHIRLERDIKREFGDYLKPTATSRTAENSITSMADGQEISNTATNNSITSTIDQQAISSTADKQGITSTADGQTISSTIDQQGNSNTADRQAISKTAEGQANSNTATKQATSRTSEQAGLNSDQQAAATPTEESRWTIIKRIFKLSLPVSAASIMLPVVANLDLAIVPQRLEVAGYSIAEATELFGYLTGMAVPLVNLATILTASLAVSLVPAISKSRTLGEAGEVYRQTASGIRICNLVCFPAFAVVLVLATPISTLIYNAPGAGPAVFISSFSILLLGYHQVTTAVLQGLGHPSIPMINMIIAAAVKVWLNWELTATMGIQGAAWATAADMGVAALINLYFIHRYIGYKFELSQFIKTLFAGIGMGAALYYTYEWLALWTMSNAIATLTAVAVGCVMYLVVLLLVKGVIKEDIAHIPMIGKYGVRVLERLERKA